MIIDTHLHVIDQSALRYPWLAGVPALNRDWPYADYAAEARRVGIERSLHMEVDVAPDQIEAETAYVGGLAAQPESLVVGAISSCRPEEAGFSEFLDRQSGNTLVKGFRRVLHVVPDAVSESALFRTNLKRLGGTRFTYDIVALPRQLDRAIAFVDLAPDVQFILDHCGVPDIKAGEREPWATRITELAERPNVVAKISGVMAYGDPASWTLETLRPWVEHVVEAFGWDRVVWGSDYPVCTLGGALSTWVAATHRLIAGASAEEQAKLLSENAKRIWAL